jgi:hypothetical protein
MDGIRSIISGTKYMSPTGRIWTVRSITPSDSRVVLVSQEADGEHCAVVDVEAIGRMIRIDPREPAVTVDDAPAATPVTDLIRM